MKEHRLFYEISRRPLALYTRLFTRLHVEGTEHIPTKGPVIIVSNHLSMMDILALSVPCKRQEHFMAKIELFQVPIFGWYIHTLGAFPVRRGESDRESLRIAADVLSSGQVLVIFPEGHRSDDHALIPGHSGVALIAMRSGAPIVPVAITGTEHVSPLRFGLWAPRVRVVFGEPFMLPSEGRRTREDLERGIDQIMRRIAALLPPAYRGVYADPAPTSTATPAHTDPLDVPSPGQAPPDDPTSPPVA
jgi:1-acyl-sn-glycerol-3-phosphate acyltransferase